ncbi:MAG: T9SS type A sorting domain-containing protein [Fibrobacterota bacterium]
MKKESNCARISWYCFLILAPLAFSQGSLSPVIVATGSWSYPPIGHEYSRNIGINQDGAFAILTGNKIVYTSNDGTTWTPTTLAYRNAHPSGGCVQNHHGAYGDLKGNLFQVYVQGCRGCFGALVPRYFKKVTHVSGTVTDLPLDYEVNDPNNWFCSYTGFSLFPVSEDTVLMGYQWTSPESVEPHVLISYNGGQDFQSLGGTLKVGNGQSPGLWSLQHSPQVLKYKDGVFALWSESGYYFRWNYFDGSSWGTPSSILNDALYPDNGGSQTFRTNVDENNVYVLSVGGTCGETLASLIWDGTTWTKKEIVTGKSYKLGCLINTLCGDYLLNFWTEIAASGTGKNIYCLAYNRKTGVWMTEPKTIVADGNDNRTLSAPFVCPANDIIPFAWFNYAGYINFCKIPLDFIVGTTAIKKNKDINSVVLSLHNQPNPFSRATTLSYSLSENKDISLRIYSLDGRLIKVLAHGKQTVGKHRVIWEPEKMSPGMYLVKLTDGQQTIQRKLILIP